MHDKLNDVLEDAAGELEQARQKGLVQSTKDSIAGWRDIGGMTVGAAMFVDLVFIMVGASLVLNVGGYAALAGYVLGTIGVIGLLEKVIRRVL